ncbi:hypothetical protein MMC17_006230 [Xylographa soralifera]|nr:hypothetical protein [Xylographa soralifera]
MSSGFVSGGTADEPIERDGEWLKAQQELEDTRRRKEEESRQTGGKSLYEVLQQNKAAKQDAFEESIRLRNQFRNLDEDEIEFLDSVLESTRAKEEAVKKETAEQLNLFRRQQEDADRAMTDEAEEGNAKSTLPQSGSPNNDDTLWTVHRKRKRVKETEVAKCVKLRKSSSTIRHSSTSNNETHSIKAVLDDSTQLMKFRTDSNVSIAEAPHSISGTEKSPALSPGPKVLGLGLDEYDSD